MESVRWVKCPRCLYEIDGPLADGSWCQDCILELAADQEKKKPSGPPIAQTCDEIKAMLLEKNRAYGDSALNPLRVFSKADPVEQIKVRIDDKLSRIVRGSNAGEDVILDLIGYLILLRIATKEQNA